MTSADDQYSVAILCKELGRDRKEELSLPYVALCKALYLICTVMLSQLFHEELDLCRSSWLSSVTFVVLFFFSLIGMGST